MITAFFWGIRGGEGKMIVHVATRGRYELVLVYHQTVFVPFVFAVTIDSMKSKATITLSATIRKTTQTTI